MKKLVIFSDVRALVLTGVAVVSFSHFIVELFGQIIPNVLGSFFKDFGYGIIVASVFIFAIIWFINTKPHYPKNCSVIVYDVFGNQSKIDGLRTE